MLLPVGTRAFIYVNRSINKNLQRRIFLEAFLISRFEIRNRLAYFFRLGQNINIPNVKNLFTWQDELFVIHNGKHNFEPKDCKGKKTEELKFWAHVEYLPAKNVIPNLRRTDLANIIRFYKMEIKVHESIRNMELLEAIQKQLTFGGNRKRNVKSLSCELQEGSILIDNSTVDIESINSSNPYWIDIFEDGRIAKELCSDLCSYLDEFFRRQGISINPSNGSIIEEEKKTIKVPEPKAVRIRGFAESFRKAASSVESFGEAIAPVDPDPSADEPDDDYIRLGDYEPTEASNNFTYTTTFSGDE